MIDTHAHLLYFENIEEIIDSMKEDNLEKIITIGTDIEDSIKSVELAEKFKDIYAVVGIYPEYANEVKQEDLEKLKEIAKNEKVVAIGEIGLDYHNAGFDAKKQKEILIKQLEIADELNLPFCIHCRSAVEDLYEVLKTHKHLIKHGGLMHCYSEGKEWVQKFLELNMYISFSGNITFKKSDRSFLKDIPLDKILVETDAPYLSPEPLRGRENKPKNVNLTARRIAEELEINFEEFDKIVSKNAKTFYFKIKND